MVVAFFDQQGMMFFNSVHLATIVIASYIVMIQSIFLKQLNWTRKAAGQWFLHWDNALEQIGTGLQDHSHLSIRRRYRRWLRQNKISVCIGSDNVKKS
jgi:hypothetical protein